MTLWIKELKITFFSLTFWVTVVIMTTFVFGNLGNLMITEPTPDQVFQTFVHMANPDEQTIQTQTYGRLLLDFSNGHFFTYPLGFARMIQPSKQEWRELQNILESAYGRDIDTLLYELHQLGEEEDDWVWIPQVIALPLQENHTYEQFIQDMEQVVEIVGKGSTFAPNHYLNSILEPLTYDQERHNFHQIVEIDQVSGAVARLLNDYLGIILALVPVFLSTTVMVRDKRSKSQDVFFSKSVTTSKLILARFSSTVFLIFIAVLVISLLPAFQSLFIARQHGTTGNLFLFYQYLTLWTLPSILAVVGLGFLITELLGSIASLMIQMLLWVVFVFTSALNFHMGIGWGVGWNLIPRFNMLGGREIFDNMWNELLINRGAWSVIGIGCCLLTIIVVDYKRKGGKAFGKSY